MDRIKRLHDYFEQINKGFEDVCYEDKIVEEEDASKIVESSTMSDQLALNGKAPKENSLQVSSSNNNANEQLNENDDEDDDDDEDDEDYDINKKDDNESGSESEPDSVDLEYQDDNDDEEDEEEEEEQEEVEDEVKEEVESRENNESITDNKNKDDNENNTENYINNNNNNNNSNNTEIHNNIKPKKIIRKKKKIKKQSKSNLVQIDQTKVQQLWKEFQEELQLIEARKRQEAEAYQSEADKKFRVRRYEFAGETFTVQESYSFREKELLKSFEKIERAQKKNFKHPDRLEPPKRRIELPDVLNQMKKSKLSTLNKTKHDWDEYKRDKDIVEELEQHQKSKHSYVERQAFLERADVRQYEKEKLIREHERKIRLQKKFANVELAT